MIEVTGLTKRFGELTVLQDISFRVKRGEHVALIGPSGAGKSVLLRCINGLTRPDTGYISIGGASVTAGGAEAQRARLMTGMVFQQFNLFTHLRAIDNIVLAPIRVLRMPEKEAFERAHNLLEIVGLADKRNAYPSELSGGQQQRVAIARALAMEPQVLLFDEPTSALDPAVAREVLDLIVKIASREKTMLIITHETQFVRDIADRVFFIAENCIYEEGTPEDILRTPQKERTKQFLLQITGR